MLRSTSSAVDDLRGDGGVGEFSIGWGIVAVKAQPDYQNWPQSNSVCN